jgi:hypothetical protein
VDIERRNDGDAFRFHYEDDKKSKQEALPEKEKKKHRSK